MSASKLFTAICRRPWLVLGAALVLSLISLVYTIQNLSFLTGRDDLMPSHAPFQVEYREFSKNFGDQDEIIVVVEANDPLLASRFSSALHDRLSKETGLFRELFYPSGLPYFQQNGMLFMPLEELHSMGRTLDMAAPVLKELAASPSIKTLFSTLTSQIDDYLINPSPEKLERLTFMLSALDKEFSGFDGKNSPLSMDLFLKGGGNDSPSMLESAGKQQIIAVRPVKEQGSFVPSEKAILKVRAELGELLRKPEFKGVTAGLTGVPVLEFEEMRSSMKDMEIAALLSLVLTIILLLLAFRGVRNTVAAMVTLLIGISLAFGFATVAVGHLNILSMAFAIMLIGLGVEYGIQVVLRYQEELYGAEDLQTAIIHAMSANIRPILLAAITTAMAFLTFVLTDFKGIAELGIIAAGGIWACVLATFTVLPAMLVLVNKGQERQGQGSRGKGQERQGQRLEWLFRRPGLIVGCTALLALLGAAAVFRVPFDFNMMNLQAKGLEPVRYAYKLMRSKENAGYFGVAVAKDRAEVASLTEQLGALPAVSHVVSLLSLVPDRQQEKLAELGRMKKIMAAIHPAEFEDSLSPMELPAVFEAFHERVNRLKTRLETEKAAQTQTVGHFAETIDRFFKGLEKEKDGNALVMLREMQQTMFAPLPEKLALLKESLEAGQLDEKDLPESLKKRFIGKDGRLLLQIVPKEEIFDKKPLAEFVGQIKSVVPNATGEPVSVYESMLILQNSYLTAFLYAFCGVAVILLLAFRSIKATLLGIAPLAAGLLLMVGGMWLFGLKFNVANIIVMPLLLGVGIDSAIYIIARYRNEGESPVKVISSSAGVGVFLNALTILFSFGALMVASHQGVFSIGAVMSLGMTAIVLAFLLFLPALLMLVDKQGKQG